MFLKNKKFFKKRLISKKFLLFFKKSIYLSKVKVRSFFFKAVFKKLIKLSKKTKTLVFFCFTNNLVLSKKSKNSRMGKGKGTNSHTVSFLKNRFLKTEKLPHSRFFKLKRKLNFFLKNKIILC